MLHHADGVDYRRAGSNWGGRRGTVLAIAGAVDGRREQVLVQGCHRIRMDNCSYDTVQSCPAKPKPESNSFTEALAAHIHAPRPRTCLARTVRTSLRNCRFRIS
jgi:hypothetical protein